MKNMFSSNKFKFVLTGERFKNNDFEPVVSATNIPGMQLGMIPQPNPIRKIERPGDSLDFDSLVVGFQVQEDFSDWLTIFNWILELRDMKKTNIKELFSDASLVLLSNKNNPNIVFNFENIFPVSISPLQLELGTNDSPLLCDVEFKFISMKVLTTA